MEKEEMKNKYAFSGVVMAIGAAILFLVFEMVGFSPSAVKVLDSRITFKYTAYQDREQYFVSYSLENTKKIKTKALVRVQLGEVSFGGRVFHSIEAQTDTAVLEPLETKAFVIQMNVPKEKNGKGRELDVRAKIKRVSRV